MKIALLCNGLAIADRGSERFATEFKSHLSKHFDIDLIGAKDTGTKTRKDYHFPHRNYKAYREAFAFGKSLYKNHTLDKYDLIFNNSGFPVSYWCNKQRKRNKTPFITRARGGSEEFVSRHFQPDCMVFLTEYHRRKIMGRSPTKSVVIPNAIDIASMDPRGKANLSEGLERPIVLSTSALVRFKRVDLTIEAMGMLGIGTLIQTSDGNMRKIWTKYGKRTLGNRFIYTGKVDRNTLIDLYNQSDIFVNASKKEAFGVVYLEAMAANLPVVTQRDHRREEIIGSAGLFGSLEDVSAYSRLLTRAALTKWGNIPREQAKKYNWDKVTQAYRELLESVSSR